MKTALDDVKDEPEKGKLFIYIALKIQILEVSMADPRINANLDLFLRFDFQQKDQYLTVYKQKHNLASQNDPNALAIKKFDEKGFNDQKYHKSLSKVAAFINEHQEQWLKYSYEQKPKLEYQLSWFDDLIRQYNKKLEEKKQIDFKNQAVGKFVFKIIFPQAFEPSLQKYIISDSLYPFHCTSFNRGAKMTGLDKKLHIKCKETYTLQTMCMQKHCHKFHEIHVKANELFGSIVFQDEKYRKPHSKHDLMWPMGQPLEDTTIILVATQGNNQLLNSLLSSIHSNEKTNQMLDSLLSSIEKTNE
jgi:hypothetical protein